jgi:hypothetical protein
MRPSDSPDASARLRSSLGVPYQSSKRGFGACRRRRLGPAVGPLAADGASEWAPLPGSTDWTYRGLPGYRAVLFGRAAVDHPAGLPSTRPFASRCAAFRVYEPLGIREYTFSGLPSCGPLARLPTHQPPPHGNDCKAGYQPAGCALTGWGSHPLDSSSEFQPTSSTSSPTGMAWSLPQTDEEPISCLQRLPPWRGCFAESDRSIPPPFSAPHASDPPWEGRRSDRGDRELCVGAVRNSTQSGPRCTTTRRLPLYVAWFNRVVHAPQSRRDANRLIHHILEMAPTQSAN